MQDLKQQNPVVVLLHIDSCIVLTDFVRDAPRNRLNPLNRFKIPTLLCRQSNIEFSIGQPLDYATNHKDTPLSHSVALITSYRRGFDKIHFRFGKALTRFEIN